MTPPAGVRRYASLVITAVLAAVAGLAFHRVFGWNAVVPVVAVASTAPTALAVLLSGPRAGRPWPLWISMVATVLAWVMAVGITLFRERLGDPSLARVIGTGLRDSGTAILTALLPAPARPELLILVHVLVWLAAFAGAEIALRTSLRAAPCVPALAVFAVALLLGVDGPGSNAPLAAATVTLIVVLVLLRSGAQDQGSPPRRLALGLPVAAALGALALVAAPYVPVSGKPYDPREEVRAPPPRQRDSVSPLDRVGAWLLSPDQVLFTVRGETVRGEKVENWRLAVLDRFDGVTWSSGASFLPTGSRVPPAADIGAHREADQQITIGDLPGIWVPAADRPRSVEGLQVVVDPVAGTLAATAPLAPGQSYRVTSSVRQWDGGELTGARSARDAEARAALELPNGPGAQRVPPQLAEFGALARQATGDASTPVEQAAALAQWLKTYAKYDVTAAPGHNYRQLDYFLGEGRRGTPEQFATAYAVLARTLGLPTRVVVGFHGGRAVGALTEVRSGDVVVWPEVKFARLGWVPFFPTPKQAGTSKADDSVAAGETLRKLEQAQKNAAGRHRGGGAHSSGQVPPRRAGAPKGTPTPWWFYVLTTLGGLIVAYLLTALIAPALRRRGRRRRANPVARIAGAWQQALEHLADVGLPSAQTLTAHEVARFGGGTVGDEALAHLRPLADLVNWSTFADASPDPRSAEEAWRHSDAVGRLVIARASRARRLGRRLRPRSFHRLRGTRRPPDSGDLCDTRRLSDSGDL
jgi:transglutaminase-like putative cysteine protease